MLARSIKSISRDPVRRTRMTVKLGGGREAITHYRVVRRIESNFGKFTFLEVKIDTGRTHQIRVHLAALGHPIVGDVLYGAPRKLQGNSESTNIAAKFSARGGIAIAASAHRRKDCP